MEWGASLEVVSTPPLGFKLCVGLRYPILEIFPIWKLVPIFLIGAVGRLSLPGTSLRFIKKCFRASEK